MLNDYVLNGVAHGDTSARLLACNGDVGALRPFIGDDGRSYFNRTVNGKTEAVPMTQNVMVGNTPANVSFSGATLRKDEWEYLDKGVDNPDRKLITAWNDLETSGLITDLPNGLGTTVFQYQTRTAGTPAVLSMGLGRRSERDRTTFDLRNTPIHVIRKDCSYDYRELLASRNGGPPLDIMGIQDARDEVYAMAEQLLLGTLTGITFFGGTGYGYTSFPDRNTYSVTAPTTAGWTPAQTVTDVLGMRKASKDVYYRGPFRMYNSTAWEPYLDADFSAAKGDNTLRKRILAIPDIQSIETVEWLGTGFTLLMVQMSRKTVMGARALPLTPIQWQEPGMGEVCISVLMAVVPIMRSNADAHCGIVHGS